MRIPYLVGLSLGLSASIGCSGSPSVGAVGGATSQDTGGGGGVYGGA